MRTHDGLELRVSTYGPQDAAVTVVLPGTGMLVRAQIPRMLAMRARLLSRAGRRRTPSIERRVVNRFLFGSPMRPRDAGLVVDQLINCPPATMSGFYRDCMTHERTSSLTAYDGIPTTVLVAPGAGHMLPLERDRLVSDELIGLVEIAVSRPDVAAPVSRHSAAAGARSAPSRRSP